MGAAAPWTATRANCCLRGVEVAVGVPVGCLQPKTTNKQRNCLCAWQGQGLNWVYLWGLCQRSRHLFEFKYQHIIYGGSSNGDVAVSSKPHRITRQGYLTNASTELNSTHTAPSATLICQHRVAIELQAWSWIRGNWAEVCAVCPVCGLTWRADKGQSGSLSWCGWFRLSQVFDFESGDNRSRMRPGHWPLERDMRWEIYWQQKFLLSASFDFDETVSMGICLRDEQALHFSNYNKESKPRLVWNEYHIRL